MVELDEKQSLVLHCCEQIMLANEFKHIRPSQPDEERKSLCWLAIGGVPMIRQRG